MLRYRKDKHTSRYCSPWSSSSSKTFPFVSWHVGKNLSFIFFFTQSYSCYIHESFWNFLIIAYVDSSDFFYGGQRIPWGPTTMHNLTVEPSITYKTFLNNALVDLQKHDRYLWCNFDIRTHVLNIFRKIIFFYFLFMILFAHALSNIA